jgi:hypothetical protein
LTVPKLSLSTDYYLLRMLHCCVGQATQTLALCGCETGGENSTE